MTEDYLHYLWKLLKFNTISLKTTEEESLRILNQGRLNDNAGPDFLEAKVEIDGTKWFGSVEIHIQSSDWRRHQHQTDPAYNNVMLHVVYEHDEKIYNQSGDTIPTLELKGLIDHQAYFQYEQFLQSQLARPCSNLINRVPSFMVINTLDQMLVERLVRKSDDIQRMLIENNSDWEQTFHQLVFKYLGMGVNGEAMLELSRRVPYLLLQKYASDLSQAEALLFGQAGWLSKPISDDYFSALRSEYLFLKQKNNLSAMRAENWKFSRMRPPNFPTLRVAQIAAIYNTYQGLFGIVRDKLSLRHLQDIFSIQPSEFWQHHYSFQSEAKRHKGNLGKMALKNLVINVIAPFAFYYGRHTKDRSYEEYAMILLESLPAEQNKIVQSFEEMQLSAINAKDSQSLLQLNNEYCAKKKCVTCKIGVYLLQ